MSSCFPLYRLSSSATFKIYLYFIVGFICFFLIVHSSLALYSSLFFFVHHLKIIVDWGSVIDNTLIFVLGPHPKTAVLWIVSWLCVKGFLLAGRRRNIWGAGDWICPFVFLEDCQNLLYIIWNDDINC